MASPHETSRWGRPLPDLSGMLALVTGPPAVAAPVWASRGPWGRRASVADVGEMLPVPFADLADVPSSTCAE